MSYTPVDDSAAGDEWAGSLEDGSIGGPSAAVGVDGVGGAPLEAASKHKTATFFHLLFKSLAVFFYVFCTFISSNFILIFVACVVLLAFDFWTVKNVTGRLLVGLRWWNEVKEDGNNNWVFESQPPGRKVHPLDSIVFWSTLYVTPIVWFVLGLVALAGLKFQWLLVVFVALALNGANLVGYWKCSKDAKQKVRNFVFSRMMSGGS